MNANKDRLKPITGFRDFRNFNPSFRLFLFFFLLFFGFCHTVGHATTYKIITGSRTGIYYPAGIAIKTLLELKQDEEKSVLFDVIRSKGAVENMHGLLKGEVDVAFVDTATIIALATKQPPFDQYQNGAKIVALAPLWSDVGHFVLRKADVKTGEINDFRELLGATVSFGPKGSTSFQSAAHTFSHNGIYFDRLYTLPDLNHRRTIKAYRDSLIDGFVLFSNEADPLIELAMGYEKVRGTLLNVSDINFQRLNKQENPIWHRYVIPANTYPNQRKEIRTIAQQNFLVTRADFDKSDALHIAKTLVENISFLEALHPALAQIRDFEVVKNHYLSYHPDVLEYYERTIGCRSIFCALN